MRAMVLAAGLGTRLRPLTNDRPKALVEVAGRTMLELTLSRLASFGIREVIINVHHFPDLVAEYLRENRNFGMRIEISRENVLLDTGGGLKKAAWFFQEDGRAEPFILHNVDVVSAIDFGQMIAFHNQNKALATLAVQKREASRYLLFDEKGELCGRQAGNDKTAEMARPVRNVTPLAFAGIHVIDPKMLSMITEDDTFSIITTYLRLAGEGKTITSFLADGYYWRDLGKPDNVAKAAQDIEQGIISF